MIQMQISSGEVHVWYAYLDVAHGKDNHQATLLSADERDRASRFVFKQDNARYTATRGILRRLLGGYLQADPAEIRFSYGTCGKPELAGSLSGQLRFNLSHAGNWAIYAISQNHTVGIDMEPLTQNLPWQQLTPLVFSANEQAEFAEIPLAEKTAAFLRGWTRKEAYVKGCGQGLSLSLDSFDVPLGTLDERRPVAMPNDRNRTADWWLCPINPIPNFAAALAVHGAPDRIGLNHWFGSVAAWR